MDGRCSIPDERCIFDVGPFRPGRLDDFSPLRESFRRVGFAQAAVKQIVEGRAVH